MPTPPVGSISVRDLEKEFGVVDGTPSAIGEYTGRTGSFAGTSLGVQGVSKVGEVAFSELRGRTAHASPELIIDTLFTSFNTKFRQDYVKENDGALLTQTYTVDPILSEYYKSLNQNYSKFLTGTTLPWEKSFRQKYGDNFSESNTGIIRYAGTRFSSFPLALLNSTTDGNIPGGHHSPYGSFATGEDTTVDGATIRKPAANIDENVHACLDNTLVYLATGKCKHIGDYGTNTSGSTPVNSRLRIGGFKFNGESINPQDESVALTWGVDHGIGAGGGKYNSFGRTVKTCMAVYNTGSVKLTDCKNAQFDAGGRFWNGNLGSKDSDTMYQKFMLLLPNKWQRVSSTLYSIGTGQMTLDPGDIAIVTSASNTPIAAGDTVLGYGRGWTFKIFEAFIRKDSKNRIISREEMVSYYGNVLTLETLPARFKSKRVKTGFNRFKAVPFTTLQEALDYMFEYYIYYEYPVKIENNLFNILWSPILNRTTETDKFLPAMFYSMTACFGMSVIAVYGNYFNKTITCDLTMPGFAPYVSIFKFVGDGYMTSRKQVVYPS